MPKKSRPSGSHRSFSSPHSDRLKLLYILLGVLIGLLVLAKALSFYASLSSPLGLKSDSGQEFGYDGRSSVNLVFVSASDLSRTEQSVVNFSPKDEKIAILNIADLTYAELPKNLGSWKVGSIYKLGQESSPIGGAELLKLSISKLIGLPVDGVVVTKDKTPAEALIASWHQNRLSVLPFLQSARSDLTALQLGRVLWAMAGVRSDKTTVLDFLSSNVTESKLLPDSTRVLGVNAVKLDLFIRNNLADPNFVLEGKSVAVFNATSHPGLTALVSRTVTNLGASVILTANADTPLVKSQVIVAKDEDFSSVTARRLIQLYAPDCLKRCKSSDSRVNDSRARINIVLGEDYYQRWFKQ